MSVIRLSFYILFPFPISSFRTVIPICLTAFVYLLTFLFTHQDRIITSVRDKPELPLHELTSGRVDKLTSKFVFFLHLLQLNEVSRSQNNKKDEK